MSFDVKNSWITAAGLPAVVIQFHGRHTCGYVGVYENSNFYGKSYSEQLECISQALADNTKLGKKSPVLCFTGRVGSDDEDKLVRRSLDVVIDVHGGITFSGRELNEDYPIKQHSKAPVWWFGFDTAHCEDPPEGQSVEYCVAECESMAAQLQKLESH